MQTSADKDKAIALLKKYKAGLCTPEEVDRIKQWYDSFNDSSDKLNPEESQLAADEASRRVLIRLFENDNDRTRRNRKSLSYILPRIAACLLVGCSFFGLIYKIRTSHDELVTYSGFDTRKGERREIQLSDGSTITLNVLSSIRVPSNFGVKDRRIILRGEAFFQVSKDKTRPFIIKTGKIQTRVVGTSFDIKAYNTDNSIKVAVATGKVQVEKDSPTGKKLIGRDLTHNHLFEYNIEKDTYSQTMADADLLSAWRSNRLIFKLAPIIDIAQTIERVYNIPVVIVGKPAKKGLYTVTFDNYPLSKTLSLLANLSGITYEINQQKLIINIQNCK